MGMWGNGQQESLLPIFERPQAGERLRFDRSPGRAGGIRQRLISAAALLPMMLGMAAWPASSQTAGGNGDLAGLSLEQLMKVPFYTASRHAQDAGNAPASITVITAAEIRAYGCRTLADALDQARGFWVTSDRNYSYVGVRGYSRPGDYNTHILLLVNGHRLNDDIYDQASIGTEFPLDVDLIERIEIMRGPGSSLYGTNAFFGVVNVITRQPPIAPAVESSGETGSERMRKGRVTVGLPNLLGGALLSLSLYRSDGVENLFFPEYAAPETNNGIAHRVDGDRYESMFALFNWRHFRFQALAGSREKLIPTGSFATVFNDSGNRTTDSRAFGELIYERVFASGLDLTARGSFDEYDYRGTYIYDVDGARTPDYDGSRGDWVESEFTASRPWGHRNTVTAGSEFRYNLRQFQNTESLDPSVSPFRDNRTTAMFAVYAQDELKLTAQLMINAGLRLDRYSTFGTSLSPRVAAIYRPNGKTSIKYTFGRAFAAPNDYEMYYADSRTQEPNPRLRPENIESHDVEVERVLTPALHVAVEAFYSDLEQLLDEDLDSDTGMFRYDNDRTSSGKGGELELDGQLKEVRAEVDYTVQRSIDGRAGTPLENSPRHLAKLRAQAPLSAALLGGMEVRYLSPQLTFENVRIPDSLVANFTVSSRKPLLGFMGSASCYNLFGRRNYDPITPNLNETRLLKNGREFRFQVSRSLFHR